MARDPTHVLKDAVGERAGKSIHAEEPQFHAAAILVGVNKTRDLLADLGIDAEFFFEFALEGGDRLFAGLDLSAGKLPLQRKRLIFAALADEQLVI